MKTSYLILLSLMVLSTSGLQLSTVAMKKSFGRHLALLLKGRGINEGDKAGSSPFMELFSDSVSFYNRIFIPKGKEKEFIYYAINEYGAQINKSDNADRTAVCYAALYAWRMIPFLVECGADLNKNDKDKPIYILDDMLKAFNVYTCDKKTEVKAFEEFKEPAILLISKGCRVHKQYNFRTAHRLACVYCFTLPLQHLLEVYADFATTEDYYYQALGNLQTGGGIEYYESAASCTIRETIQKRAALLEKLLSRNDAHSYFSLLPLEISEMIKNYSKFGKQNRKIMESIAKYPVQKK